MAKTIHMKPDIRLFYADAETTGLDPLKQEMTQLACIIEINGAIVDECNIFMRPARTQFIQPQALAIQGKTLKQVMAYPPRKIGFAKFIEFIDQWTDKSEEARFTWVGQNPDFDIGFMREEFKLNANAFFKAYFGYHKVDLIGLAILMRLLGHFHPRNFKLETMAAELGIVYKAHDAQADIRTTRQIVHLFMEKLKKPAGANAGKQLSFL